MAPIALQAARHGVRSVLNVGETLENGLLGAVFSLVGTYLIAMRKGAETLDAEQRSKVTIAESKTDKLAAECQRLASMLEKPKRTPAEEYHHGMVAAAIKERGEPAKIALRHLRHQGTVTVTANRDSGNLDCSSVPPGIAAKAFCAMLGQLVVDQIVKGMTEYPSFNQTRSTFKLAPEFIGALDELLYTESKS